LISTVLPVGNVAVVVMDTSLQPLRRFGVLVFRGLWSLPEATG
jgi:hypothetical protein